MRLSAASAIGFDRVHPPLPAGAAHELRASSKRIDDTVGGAHAQAALYQLVSIARDRYFSAATLRTVSGDHTPTTTCRSIASACIAGPAQPVALLRLQVHLAGQLLNYKGDRVAMANSVETRYPFLDEDVIAFTSRLAPRWKLRGLRDKYLLRHAAARVLPTEVGVPHARPCSARRSPRSFLTNAPPFVRQLMSPEALRKTGYFDRETVRPRLRAHRLGQADKVSVFKRLGLSGVVATQLWHHLYISGGLCELPNQSPAPQVARPAA